MFDIYLDLETYSATDLKASGVYRYVTDPDFMVLMAAYAFGRDEPVKSTTDQATIRKLAQLCADPNNTIWAHNANFERVSLSSVLGYDVSAGQLIDPGHWEDTQALAAVHGWPQSLERLAVAAGGEQKDTAGTRLINTFSKPNRKGERTLPDQRPEDWKLFLDYCVQDVVTLQDVAKFLPGWPTDMERRIWVEDQRINDRGIRMDTDMVAVAAEVADLNRIEQELEVTNLTGVHNPGSTVQLVQWLQDQGVRINNLRKETVQDLLDFGGLDPTAQRVLELRQDLAVAASKKYLSALDRVSTDGRLRGSFQYHGAHTGRWAGRGVQLQNLPRETLEEVPGQSEDDTIAQAVMRLMVEEESNANTLKALVRSMFLGPMTVVDYSAIEARVLAWLAGESWALEAFQNGRDIYVETASRMGPQYTRHEGKVATLALGYNGGVGSLAAMGAEGTHDQLQQIVWTWRSANENIVQLWHDMEDGFRYGNRWVGDHIYVERDEHTRILWLPSGRGIGYHRVGQQWVNKTWPSGDTSRVRQLSFADPKIYPRRADTYGGRLEENVTQGVARDVLAHALVRLEDAGLPVIGHVHDEILVEGDHLDRVTELMVQPADWMDGLPMDAEGGVVPRYRKI